jgi:hypothetical protein
MLSTISMVQRVKLVPVTPEVEARGLASQAIPKRRLPFDEAWREIALTRYRELAIGQDELARVIGASQGTMSHVLGKEAKAWQSDYVERLSFFLNIDLPYLARLYMLGERAREEGGDDALRDLLDVFDRLHFGVR